MKPQQSSTEPEKGNSLANMSSSERLNLREIMKEMEAREWIKRYRKKMMEEGRGEAQYWWQLTLEDIAKKRGQPAADDLRIRMNTQKEKK
jgi:hypothetical protein